jgi:hypothetical protein
MNSPLAMFEGKIAEELRRLPESMLELRNLPRWTCS